MSVTSSQLRKSYKDFGSVHGGNQASYFPFLYLQTAFGVSPEIAATQTTFKIPSCGFSAYHIDRETRNLYLIQCLWTTSYEALTPYLQQLIVNIERVFAVDQASERSDVDRLLGLLDGRQKLEDSFIDQLRAELVEKRALVDQVVVQLVYQGDPERVATSHTVAQLREDLSNKVYVLEEFFGRSVAFTSTYICERTNKRNSDRARKVQVHHLSLTQVSESRGPDGERMQVGFARLMDLRAMFGAMGQEFFERNIRAGLSEEAGPNRAILNALRDIVITKELDPRVFAFYHNGVTLSAERIEQTGDQYHLTAPRLLNGAQTVTSFDRFIKGNNLTTMNGRLKEIRLLCKIITEATPKFVTAVTINNNRQNPVMPWNLRANDLIQVMLQDWFAGELGIYYERQENAFLNLQDADLERLAIIDDKALELQKLARTYLASEGMIDKMSRMREVFESDTTYDQVFNESRLKADAKHVVLCYKVDRCLRKILKGILEQGENSRYAYLYRARNLVWALLCQAILNHRSLEARASEFGRDLVVAQEFREWIEKLVESQVRPLIGEIVRQEPYAEQKAAERYGFLTTRSLYDRCFDLGREKYEWRAARLR